MGVIQTGFISAPAVPAGDIDPFWQGDFNQGIIGQLPNYYIALAADGGDDGNDGTSLTDQGGGVGPWALTGMGYRVFDNVNSSTKHATYAQNVLGVKNGTYGLYDILGRFDDNSVAGTNRNTLRVPGGTQANPTIIVAETRGGVIIDGQRDTFEANHSGLRNDFGLLGAIGDWVIIDGFTFVGAHYCISNNNADAANVIWRNCVFKDQVYEYGPSTGTNSCCLYFKNSANCTVTNCRFEGCSAPYDSERHAHIQTYDATSGFTIEYSSMIRDSSGGEHCLQFKQGNNKNVTIRNCYLENQRTLADDDLVRWDGDSIDGTAVENVYNNVFYRNAAGGSTATFYIKGDNGVAGQLNMHHNTWSGPFGSAGGLINLWVSSSQDLNFHHNILNRTNTAGTQGDIDLPPESELGTMDYNGYIDSPGILFRYNDGANTATGLSAWQGVTTGIDDNSIEFSAPGFVGIGSEAAQFALQASSVLYEQGSSGEDIGAPIRTEQVGASWIPS